MNEERRKNCHNTHKKAISIRIQTKFYAWTFSFSLRILATELAASYAMIFNANNLVFFFFYVCLYIVEIRKNLRSVWIGGSIHGVKRNCWFVSCSGKSMSMMRGLNAHVLLDVYFLLPLVNSGNCHSSSSSSKKRMYSFITSFYCIWNIKR